MRALKKFCQRFFHLPSPKELGWSEHNALGSRSFTPFQEGKTWEDWREYMKEKYPVKYFLVEVFPTWFWGPQRWVKDGWYWLKCHILPSYRFHIVDLRGVDPLSDYTHGYRDPGEVMRLAAWKALRDYVEKEEPTDPASWCTPEEMAQEHMQEQKRTTYDEPMALYKYWMEDRAAEKKEEERLFQLTKGPKEAHDKAAYDAATSVWLEYYRANERREQEMFMKLCALREHLWT